MIMLNKIKAFFRRPKPETKAAEPPETEVPEKKG